MTNRLCRVDTSRRIAVIGATGIGATGRTRALGCRIHPVSVARVLIMGKGGPTCENKVAEVYFLAKREHLSDVGLYWFNYLDGFT